MFDVNPTSDRWKKICEIADEISRDRVIRRYVYELESNVNSYKSELKELRRENKQIKNEILSLSVVKEAIDKARHDAYVMDNFNKEFLKR